jgi:Phage tail sheath protein subtilisin-like domain/Phage tail sheath C-terminal domain
MVNQASPAISIVEIDLSSVVTGQQSSTGAMAGNFNWGPVDDPKLIDNEGTLASVFGVPADDGRTIGPSVDFLCATQFLTYSNRLYVNRIIVDNGGSMAKTAQVGATGGPKADFLVKNKNDYENQVGTWADDVGNNPGPFVAKFCGALGNSLSVSVCNAGQSVDFSTWKYASLFDGAPSTSPWLESLSDSNTILERDEVHVVVIDRLGRFTGTRGAVLETFAYVSVAKGAKTADGGSNYLPEVLSSGSAYVYFGYFEADDALSSKLFGALAFTTPSFTASQDFGANTDWTSGDNTVDLSSGSDGGAVSANEYIAGYDVYSDTATLTIDMLIAPSMTAKTDQVAVVSALNAIAASKRRDCVVVASPPREAIVAGYGTVADPVTPTLEFANEAGVPASSYLILDNNFLKVLDKYNDRYIWIPAASSTAGIMAATDLAEGPWFSPAGQKRGQYFGIVDIAYNPTKAQRDQLYAVGVNPIVNLPGRGTTLYGDKTRETRPSAFNRINVRRLFLNIERAISNAAIGVMFEFNDEFTRAEFVNIVEPYLREIKGRRGIVDFAVQCDASNNPPNVVDRNELVASIFVKPSRSINYVTLNFIAVRSGVVFEEIVGTV